MARKEDFAFVAFASQWNRVVAGKERRVCPGIIFAEEGATPWHQNGS